MRQSVKCHSAKLDTYCPTSGGKQQGPQTGWIGPMGPPRKIGKKCAFLGFFRPVEKIAGRAPNGAGTPFSGIKNSLTIWAERILILRTFDFWIFWGPKFASLFSWVKHIFRSLPSFFHGWKIFSGICRHFFHEWNFFSGICPHFFHGWGTRCWVEWITCLHDFDQNE